MDEFIKIYREVITGLGDQIITWARPESWPVSGPTSTWPLVQFEVAFTIALCYILFVVFGSLIMYFLPPVPGLYGFKFVYNIVQVMLCSYMCIEAGIRAYFAGYSWIPCNAFSHTNPPIAFILYIFYLSKILDFMDTVFIIAEKKWKQLSFLHVYHHTTIFLFYWLNVNVGYDGDIYLTIILNGLIHTVMYTYYFVSLHAKEIWWKSGLTLSQMIQFILMNAQAGWLLYTNCGTYPRNITIAYLVYIVSLLFLFLNFFIASYILPGKKSKGARKSKTH